ncbi:MAG: hypothetical protein H7Z13_00065 [Ferruginibacter sp.]|nr:hypothetical protein [Ferruginibacter sp.]
MNKKQFLFWVCSISTLTSAAQNVGIGTTNPKARLHVADSAVLYTGDVSAPPLTTTINPPVQGAGTRLFWFPPLGAFRAGYVDGVQWDRDSIGQLSFAAGFNTKAKGRFSVALGNNSTASGDQSFSMGSSIANGAYSTSMGQGTTASGVGAFVSGGSSVASGNYTSSMGEQTVAKARGGFAAGVWNDETDAPDAGTTAATDRVFQIGNGSNVERSNALTVLRNGNTGIGITDPVFRLDLKDRMRIRSGGDATTSPGIFLNNLNNTSTASFIGMQSNNRVGFYGSVNGWGLTMNTDNGNIGISNTNSNAPLQFANDIRNRKLVLYETANNDHQFYGFGVTSSVLRYQTATTGDDHVFYAGNGTASSTELVRIRGNGYMGIGVADPQFRLDIKDRMRIRSGGDNNTSAGIYLNNSNNSSLPAFIGMQSDNQVGFFGSGTGWGLTMNTQNGALTIGGSTGNPGQVLTSNGAAANPGWTTAGNIIKTQFAGLLSNSISISGADFKEFTNSAYTVTLASPSRVILFCKTQTRAESLVPGFDAESRWRLELWLNGTVSRTYRVNGSLRASLSFNDNKLDLTTGPEYFDLPAGTHHFTFFATNLIARSSVSMQVTSMIIPL